MKKIPLHTTKSLCKTLFSRYGKMGWENFLGRMIGGVGLPTDKHNGSL